MVRTRMPGGVGGKAREGLPIPIRLQSFKDLDVFIQHTRRKIIYTPRFFLISELLHFRSVFLHIF